jgi:chloramphenicol 3-O-phosphotransferase
VTLRVSVEEALRRAENDPSRTFSRDADFLRRHYSEAPVEARLGDLTIDVGVATPSEIAHAIKDCATGK